MDMSATTTQNTINRRAAFASTWGNYGPKILLSRLYSTTEFFELVSKMAHAEQIDPIHMLLINKAWFFTSVPTIPLRITDTDLHKT
jgi:hypothetical protein